MNKIVIIFFFSNLNYAVPGQFGFQYPATQLMYGLINLHHHMMFILFFIVFFVFALIFLIIESFSIYGLENYKNFLKVKKLYNVNLTHNAFIEIL